MTDWDELGQALGGLAGKELKSDVDWDGTNSSGFTARPFGQAFDNTELSRNWMESDFLDLSGKWWLRPSNLLGKQ